LQSLGHFGGSLPALAESPHTTPFEMYLRLGELLGELSALKPGQADPKCAPYNHDTPLPCFEEIDSKIRRLLVDKPANLLEVPFKETASGYLEAALRDEHLTRPTAYFLGIKTRMDHAELARYVTQGEKFKLMPASLAGSALLGVELREENFPLFELPAEPGLYYFRVALKESRRWSAFEADKAAVLEWKRSEFNPPDARFALYMTLPP
jgi:predicted component of type VI protein secretion system